MPNITPRPHAAQIKAWADGAPIQSFDPAFDEAWKDEANPRWAANTHYRVKPGSEYAQIQERITEPVFGDLLPLVGETVLIHLARQDEWVLHTVTGYYVWGDLNGQAHLQRVFVRVLDDEGYTNARMLCDIRRADGSEIVAPNGK